MDLSTTYMGMTLKHPIVPSASPLSKNLDSIRRLEDAGASAIVMYSLFEEQIATESQMLDHYLTYGTESYSEALSYFPQMENYNVGPQEYLDLIRSGQGGCRHSHHRQPERCLVRRLDRVCTLHRGCGRRRPGAERLLHTYRSVHGQRRDRADVSRRGA